VFTRFDARNVQEAAPAARNGQATAHKASLEAVLNKEIVAGLLLWDSQRGVSDPLNHV
jgi:hypothetical protein